MDVEAVGKKYHKLILKYKDDFGDINGLIK